MAMKEHTVNRTIDLSLEDGNVFALIGKVKRLAKQLDKNSALIIKEMMSGDYGNAVYVFDREFGDYFDIILPKGMTIKSVRDSYNRANLNSEEIERIYSK